MSRQQKRIQRESEIVAATLLLLEEKSFLDLRMSDVAQAAECSMGAIYSHFSSKEDLLLGCAYFLTRQKIQVLHRILDADLVSLEKMVMISLCMWQINQDRPEHFALSQLAMNPSVWQRASSNRSNAMNELGDYIDSQLKTLVRQALSENGFEKVSDQSVAELMMGLWGLSSGLYQIKESGFGVFNADFREDDGVDLHLANIQRYLAGWNLDSAVSRARLSQLAEAVSNYTTLEAGA
ncbi:TetR/AcrR family transcriptional regulator [Endozoicomonas arenosclerae]|uniref:TetR/AcrR family transcriptional regulator n=1 Tax=Endozoicomonas arenosclerae TaxID=1633495 RepID=UPI000783F245|nr:TetR/AcrR family transcriptional regulator [Endozoicomonas arenosclerae]